jgi:hypothetical protein
MDERASAASFAGRFCCLSFFFVAAMTPSRR